MFSKLSQITIKTLIWPHYLRRRKKFEKKAKKGVFMGTFWTKNFDQKIAFFRRALPPQN